MISLTNEKKNNIITIRKNLLVLYMYIYNNCLNLANYI